MMQAVNKKLTSEISLNLLFISFLLLIFFLPLLSIFLKICFLISIILFLLLLFDNRIKIRIDRGFLILLGLLPVWILISSFFSTNFYESINWLYLMIVLFYYAILTSIILTKYKHRLIFLIILLLFLWVILLCSLFQYFNISSSLMGKIIILTFNNQYQLANYLAVIIPFLFPLILFSHKNRLIQTFLLITLFTAITILLLLQSIFSYVALFIGIFLMVVLVFFDKRLKASNKSVVVWLLSIPVFVLIVATFLFFILNKSILANAGLNNSLNFRALLWKDSLRMIMENFLFGVGGGNFRIVFPLFTSDDLWGIITKQNIDSISSPLNDYLRIWSETGIVGIVIFLFLIIKTINMGIKRYFNAKGSFEKAFLLCNLSGLFSILVLMLFSSILDYLVFGMFLFIFIGCLNSGKVLFVENEESIVAVRFIAQLSSHKYDRYILGKYKFILFIVIFLLMSIIGGIINTKKLVGELYYQIGEKYFEFRNYNQALINYKIAETYVPHSMNVYRNYGNALKLTKNYNSAIEVYRKYLNLNPNDFKTYLEIAYCYIVINNPDAELGELLKAYRIRKDSKVGIEIGNLYYRKGEYKNAIEYYEKAKDKEFFKSNARLQLADSYVKSGEADKSLKYMDEIKETFKENFKFHVILGDIYRIKEDNNKAIENYQKAIGINSKDLTTLVKIAELYKKEEKWKEALGYFEKALELDKENENILINISYCWNNLGEFVKAINTLKEITTRINPKNLDAHINLGVVYLRFNLPEYAYNEWKEALKIDPNNEMVKKHIEDLKKNYPKTKFE